MDWKNNLGNLMSENGHYTLDLLNKELKSWCKEWTDYVKEFNGMSTELNSVRKEYSDSFITCNLIKVYQREKSIFPFMAYLGYFVDQNEKLCLFMDTTQSFVHGEVIKTMDRESDDKYLWHSEKKITDAEITEQGFVLQLLNSRFRDYLNSGRK